MSAGGYPIGPQGKKSQIFVIIMWYLGISEPGSIPHTHKICRRKKERKKERERKRKKEKRKKGRKKERKEQRKNEQPTHKKRQREREASITTLFTSR